MIFVIFFLNQIFFLNFAFLKKIMQTMYPMSVFFRNLCKISVKKFTRVYGFRTMIHSLSASII